MITTIHVPIEVLGYTVTAEIALEIDPAEPTNGLEEVLIIHSVKVNLEWESDEVLKSAVLKAIEKYREDEKLNHLLSKEE